MQPSDVREYNVSSQLSTEDRLTNGSTVDIKWTSREHNNNLKMPRTNAASITFLMKCMVVNVYHNVYSLNTVKHV